MVSPIAVLYSMMQIGTDSPDYNRAGVDADPHHRAFLTAFPFQQPAA